MHTKWTQQSLFDCKIINKNNYINPHFTRKVQQQDTTSVNYVDSINIQTSFLINPTFKERIFCIIHNITKCPTCKHCNQPTNLQYHHDISGYVYTTFCTPKCSILYRDETQIIKSI